jgi:hypothetical protein
MERQIASCSYVDLYWLPLGAGSPCVRGSGAAYEAWMAAHAHRHRQSLFHSALKVRAGGDVVVVEMTPAWVSRLDRGVVSCGSVGSLLLGRSRLFRYEVRRWEAGEIGDVGSAVESPQRVSNDPDQATDLLDLVAEFPTSTWGRDEQRTGDMWNSNSLTSWLLARSGHDMSTITPPSGGRAPGWAAGLTAAQRLPHRAEVQR